jgi:hypothetical protein
MMKADILFACEGAGMSAVWTPQRRPIWIVMLLFVAGLFAVIIWHPVLIIGYPRQEFLEWYIVSGLLLIGLTAASRDETIYASMFALYALAVGLIVATPIPALLAKLAALGCIALGLLLGLNESVGSDTFAASE